MMTPSDHLADLALKEQEPSLLRRNIMIAAETAGHDVLVIGHAAGIAAWAHRNQTRAVRGNLPRTPYIEHPLRNTLRLYRYGVTDQAMIIAELLHDTVEDCAAELITLAGGDPASLDIEMLRALALTYIAEQFGEDVEDIVSAMTNPIADRSASREQRNREYAEHVEHAIGDPRVAVCKLADFADNAAGLYHQEGQVPDSMVVKLAGKYLPVVAIFRRRLAIPDVAVLVSPQGFADMQGHLDTAERELSRILSAKA